MEAYYKKTGIRLFHGDVIEVLNTLPNESVDLIFADPPLRQISHKQIYKDLVESTYTLVN